VVVPAFAGMPKLPDGNPFHQRRQTFPSWRCWMISTSSYLNCKKKNQIGTAFVPFMFYLFS
jgi:hypothetical protein